MGRYFNPATEQAITAVGGVRKHIEAYHAVVSERKEDESIGILVDRGIFRQVPDVSDPLEFKEFEKQWQRGTISILGLYVMPKKAKGWDY